MAAGPGPAVLGPAVLGNFRLGWIPAALVPLRRTRARVLLAGDLSKYRIGSITILDRANDAPNTCSLTFNAEAAPSRAQRIRITINSDAPRLLFSGALEKVDATYEGRPTQLAYPCIAQDDTPKANRRIPLGYWENVSATIVAQELVAGFAPGFSAAGVQADLPAITVHFEGSEAGMNGCLRQICKLIGGYFYWEDLVLYLFLELESSDAPDALDTTPGRVEDDPPIRVSRDDNPIRTRVYGKGHAEATLVEVAAGAAVIPLPDVSMLNPAGGQVISESQILDYTGTVVGGAGALVGTTVTPTNAPTGSLLTAASGIDSGDHQWAYTFYDGSGQTLPSPLSAILALGSVVTAPASAPTVTRIRGGNIAAGDHQWKTAFVDSAGQITTVSPASSTVAMVTTPTAPTAMGTAGYADLPGVAQLDANAQYSYGMTFIDDATDLESEMGPAAALGDSTAGIYHGYLLRSGTSTPPAAHTRRFYRTEGNGSTFKRLPGGENGFEVDHGDYWWEGYPDSALGAAAPTAAHYKQADVVIPVSLDPNVVSVNVYRTEAGGSTFKLAGTVSNGTTLWRDNVADGSLGATAPTSSTAVYRQVALVVANGPTGTTGKKIYRTAAGGSQLKLAYTIADNTTTTQTDSLADSGLGANAPISNTSGLVTQTGDVPAGSTSLLVTATGPFRAADGWAFIGNLPVRYTGTSASSITGIPPTGVGALNTTIRYGAEIIAASMLTGVSGLGRPLIKGAPIHIWVQEDDLDAQAELAAREASEGYPSDGIVEHRIVDERRGEASLRQLCRADLRQFSRGIVSVPYVCRDVKTKSGKPIVIDIPSPLIDETLTIQDVTITEIDVAPGLAPKFTVLASSIRVSVEDLLRRMAGSLEGR